MTNEIKGVLARGVDYQQLDSWNWCVKTSWAVLVKNTCPRCFSTLERSVVDGY